MQIAQSLNENNFNQMAKLIETNSIPHDLLKGNLKRQLQKHTEACSTPASVKSAELHQKAVKYGYKELLNGRSAELCSCCNFRIENESIAICEGVHLDEKRKKAAKFDDLEYKFRSDVAMFLTFIKTVVYYLLFHALLHSVFSLYTSQFLGSYCRDLRHCHASIWNTLSMSNKIDRQDLINIVDLLHLGSIVLSLGFFVCARRSQRRMYSLIDEEAQTEADYTLMVSNVPILDFPKKGEESAHKLEFYYRKHLEEYFAAKVGSWLRDKNEWGRRKDRVGQQLLELMKVNEGELRSEEIVKSVSLCYNLSRLEVLQEIKKKLIDAYEGHTEQENTSLLESFQNEDGQPLYSERFSSIPQRVKFLNDCEIILNGQFARDNSFLFSVTHFVGHVFVSFQYEHYKEHLQQLYNKNPKAFRYEGQYLTVEDACHPTDVYWENLKVRDSDRTTRKLGSYVTLAVVLFLSFIVLLLLELWKEQWSKNASGEFINLAKSYSLCGVISLLILAINWGLELICKQLTVYEKHKTHSDYTFSLLIKMFAAKAINTIMLYFFIALFFSFRESEQRFMGPNGLILQISMLLAASGLLQVLLSLLWPKELWVRFRRWWRYYRGGSQLRQGDRVPSKFQVSLNREFEFPNFNMAKRYSYYLVMLYTALFYSYLVPVSVPVVCLIFALQFWVDKFNLLRRSSLKYHFDFKLCQHISKFYESSVILFAAGNLIFSVFMHNYTIGLINIISFGVALLYVCLIWLAPDAVQRSLFGSYETCEKFTYDDCMNENKFLTTYWSHNPATFLIEESKVTGKRGAANPNNFRQSKEPFMTSVL